MGHFGRIWRRRQQQQLPGCYGDEGTCSRLCDFPEQCTFRCLLRPLYSVSQRKSHMRFSDIFPKHLEMLSTVNWSYCGLQPRTKPRFPYRWPQHFLERAAALVTFRNRHAVRSSVCVSKPITIRVSNGQLGGVMVRVSHLWSEVASSTPGRSIAG